MCIFPENYDSMIFLGISALLNLEFWPYIKYSNEQFVKRNYSLTAAWNFLKVRRYLDTRCITRNVWYEIFYRIPKSVLIIQNRAQLFVRNKYTGFCMDGTVAPRFATQISCGAT